MSEHYYSRNPSVESNQQNFNYTLRGHSLRFTTDQGVFSKGDIDFGSRLLIDSIHLADVEGRILDVGCGYGPIGLTMAKEYPDRIVDMVDVNERALSLAEKNAQSNDITNVEIYYSNALQNVEQSSYAMIITNPPIRAGKKVVHEIFEEGFSRLVKGGELWIVIQKKQGAPSAIEKLKTLTEDVEIVMKSKGYFIIKARR
ncbi:16S rRNA (guanine1207-N2)-methyltransferase [Bacillus mesophilus]|uniref:Class I SAM-dependent methyltransferase n=1 Tax=Bacillus mesophilus TaxID=1808955 RepID=A0A6M0QCD2_9BACI|nr:class I SAM-dependent methyltransferase [Bacillus mesophilus]MBM7663372.1 16S rRNA (guanine1207-N2)-methyltransferase [Bacillus mesophilus]NEY74023.1 class I SAM-dependent methyltransferase [Bacillus mesophilus]